MKKLQVFISSTYKDLLDERQAAVEAILSSGHIPAGMELFSAGSESQLETIKRWIEGSDVYLLILGGRYGAIEPNSQKSYTHVEYEYAIEKNIKVFAVVIGEQALQEKVKNYGQDVLELDNQEKYRNFKQLVLSKMCRFFEDSKDIKLAIHETLAEFLRQYKFSGWVSGRELELAEGILEENRKLLKENKDLQTKLNKFSKENLQINQISEFVKLKGVLSSTSVQAPKSWEVDGRNEISLLDLLEVFENQFAIGIRNEYGMEETEKFLFFRVAPHLLKFNLLEKTKVPGKGPVQQIQTSKFGYEFLQYCALNPEGERPKKIVKKKAN